MQSRITLQNAENYQKIVSAYQQAQNCSKMGLSDMRYNSRLFNMHHNLNAGVNRCLEVRNSRPCYEGANYFIPALPIKTINFCAEPEFVITRSKLVNRSPELKELKFPPLELCNSIVLVNAMQYVAEKVIPETKIKKIKTPRKVPSWYKEYKKAKVSYEIKVYDNVEYGVYVGDKFAALINYHEDDIQLDLGEIISDNGRKIKRIVLHKFPASAYNYKMVKQISNLLIQYLYQSLEPGSEYFKLAIIKGETSRSGFKKLQKWKRGDIFNAFIAKFT